MGEGTGHGFAGQRDDSGPGQGRVECIRFDHATRNTVQFKTYKLFFFFPDVFHLIFLDYGWL